MRSYRVTNQHPSLPWNVIAHEFLDPSASPESETWRAILNFFNLCREWPRHCRKVHWTKMAQNGPKDHFGRNDLIPIRILAFARPKWTKMVRQPYSGHSCLWALRDRDAFQKYFGRGEKTPTPKTRFSIWTLLRTPGRFTTRPRPLYFTTKMPVVRPFSVLSKDEMGP